MSLVVGEGAFASALAARLGVECSRTVVGRPTEIWHCGGLLPTTATEADAAEALERTRSAAASGARIHHVSTMAIAGGFEGSFTEKHFDEGQPLPHVLAQAAFDQEFAVRTTASRWRIYRLAHLLGPLPVDGPAHFFESLLMTSLLMPAHWPLYGPDFGQTDVVPVSFAVDAIAALRDLGEDESCFHIGSGAVLRTADVHNAFATVAAAPRAHVLERAGGPGSLAWSVYRSFMTSPRLAKVRDKLFAALAVPEVAISRLAYDFTFDCTDTVELHGLSCPPLEDYVGDVWSYWREARIKP